MPPGVPAVEKDHEKIMRVLVVEDFHPARSVHPGPRQSSFWQQKTTSPGHPGPRMPGGAVGRPEVTSREQWLVARKELLAREKEFTRQRDALNADRRRMPMVAIDKDYAFEGSAGRVGLLDMFDGCSQLILQHVMFDPSWDEACPGCSAGFDELAPGLLRHLRTRDTAFAGVSRAPFPKLAA